MIFDFLKKKKAETEKETKAEAVKKEEPKKSSSPSFNYSAILLSPHVTEKATMISANNQYVFKVFPRANKIEIKKAIESFYRVKVTDVKIINVGGKVRRSGRGRGWKKGYKKAIIKLAAGQKIEAVTV